MEISDIMWFGLVWFASIMFLIAFTFRYLSKQISYIKDFVDTKEDDNNTIYGSIYMDNIPDNKYFINSTRVKHFKVNDKTYIPRVGDSIFADDENHNDIRYSGVVSNVVYNVKDNYIVVYVDCKEVIEIKPMDY